MNELELMIENQRPVGGFVAARNRCFYRQYLLFKHQTDYTFMYRQEYFENIKSR